MKYVMMFVFIISAAHPLSSSVILKICKNVVFKMPNQRPGAFDDISSGEWQYNQ